MNQENIKALQTQLFNLGFKALGSALVKKIVLSRINSFSFMKLQEEMINSISYCISKKMLYKMYMS